MRHYHSQLRSLITGAAIVAAGGMVFVTIAGSTKKETLYSAKTNLPIANQVALVNGSFDFNVLDTAVAVDLFILSPTGHFTVLKNVKPSADASIMVDTSRVNTHVVIPFHFSDASGETRTGITLPGAVQPSPAVDVRALDAGITIDVGTLSSDTGDADGFMDGVSVATAGYIKPSNLSGSVTMGADLLAGAGISEQNTSRIGKEVTYTLSGSPDTAGGYIILPVQLRVTTL